jgi:hypothetical protein
MVDTDIVVTEGTVGWGWGDVLLSHSCCCCCCCCVDDDDDVVDNNDSAE